MGRGQRRVVGLALLLVASATEAFEYPVVYMVEEKALRRSASAETALTVAVAADASCDAPFLIRTVALGDVDVLTRLRPVKLRGGERPSRAIELRHTIIDTEGRPSVFVRITGPGIEPVGDACQAQPSAAMASTGTIGPVGPPGPRGLGLAIVDANDTYVGLPYRDSTASIGDTGVVRSVDGNAVLLQVRARGVEALGFTVFHYESTDCTGTPLITVDWPRGVRLAFSTSPAGPFFYGAGPAIERTVHSWAVSDPLQTQCVSGWTFLPPDRCCQARTFDGEYAPAAVFEATFESPFRVKILGGGPPE